MSVFNIINPLDILASDVGLILSGRGGVKTKVGGCLSLCYIGTLIWISYIIINEYLSTSSPTVTYEYFSGKDYPRIDLISEKNLPILFFFFQRWL